MEANRPESRNDTFWCEETTEWGHLLRLETQTFHVRKGSRYRQVGPYFLCIATQYDGSDFIVRCYFEFKEDGSVIIEPAAKDPIGYSGLLLPACLPLNRLISHLLGAWS